MIKEFKKETESIYRLKVPFDNLYTSVFLVSTKEIKLLVDCATTDFDVNEYIIPALNKLGLTLEEIDAIVLSHKHADHAGGLNRLLEIKPNLKVVDYECEFDGVSVVMLSGHMPDCVGVYVKNDKALITCDAVQGHGVEKYRCYLADKDAYIKTLEKIRFYENLVTLLYSHAYEPWYKDRADGKNEIQKCLNDCIEYIKGENK